VARNQSCPASPEAEGELQHGVKAAHAGRFGLIYVFKTGRSPLASPFSSC